MKQTNPFSRLGVWTAPVSCAVGDTTCTITDASITTSSIIDPFLENTSGNVQGYSNITVTSGQAVITFDALTEASSIRLHVINL